ncbi:trichohyalin-like [Ceratitis capitata]|uniref:trichohyalin-like n=1 Tax=Ceratitis capitata TaxID=7213 RepID=UPI00032A2C39|nr:trichohyalin-like [Ceratitis capitata]
MKNSERRSIYKQIKDLVKKAQTVAQKELEQRRQRLQAKLELEDKLYQEEFAENVKSRIIEIKSERDRRDKEFLQEMIIKRELEDCYEIREALSRRDMLQVKEAQLEQITEKQRALIRQRQTDEYWRKVCDTHSQHYKKQLEKEQRLLKNMKAHKGKGLDEQIALHQHERELELERKRQEAEELAKHLHELSLEKCRLRVPPKMQIYRKELLDMIAEKKAKREGEERDRIEEHRKLMREIASEQQDHSAALLQRKRAVYKATMEYIDYARRLHKLEDYAQAARYARIDDLRHVDICTKSNLALEVKRKAELAKLYYAELLRQMCEEYERRQREAHERREQKIIKNRFVHPEKSKAELLAEQHKVREELDHQLAENARLQAEEEEKYNKQLELVADDRDFCKRVAEQYIADQKDHLPTHPNWLIYQCPNKNFAVKCVSSEVQGLSKSEVKLERDDAYIEPWGCFARLPNDCVNHSYLSPLKRGLNADQKLRNATLCLPRESVVVLR